MPGSRWLPRLGPPGVALGALALLSSTSFGAVAPPWTPPACPAGHPVGETTPAEAAPISLDAVRSGSWYRLDPMLDPEGALAGQRLFVGRNDGRASRSIELPAESTASGPYGSIILVVEDDERRSRLGALDLAAACLAEIGEESAVVRRAVLDRAGSAVYESRVDRSDRSDLGIWRRPLDGGVTRQVLGALEADERFGPTYSTELSWSEDGDSLVVQSCGQVACRTRIVEIASGRAALIADPDLGSVIGLVDGRVLAFAACRGLPCPIVSIDPSTGERNDLVESSALASLAATDDGVRLVHELPGATPRLAVVDPSGRSASLTIVIASGLRLAAPPAWSRAGTRLPLGTVGLSASGRPGPSTDGPHPVVLDLRDGSTVPLWEVTR